MLQMFFHELIHPNGIFKTTNQTKAAHSIVISITFLFSSTILSFWSTFCKEYNRFHLFMSIPPVVLFFWGKNEQIDERCSCCAGLGVKHQDSWQFPVVKSARFKKRKLRFFSEVAAEQCWCKD